jgi:hypothetical protein
VNVISLPVAALTESRSAPRRDQRSDLEQVRAAPLSYVSPLKSLSRQEKDALHSYDGPEISEPYLVAVRGKNELPPTASVRPEDRGVDLAVIRGGLGLRCCWTKGIWH